MVSRCSKSDSFPPRYEIAVWTKKSKAVEWELERVERRSLGGGWELSFLHNKVPTNFIWYTKFEKYAVDCPKKRDEIQNQPSWTNKATNTWSRKWRAAGLPSSVAAKHPRDPHDRPSNRERERERETRIRFPEVCTDILATSCRSQVRSFVSCNLGVISRDGIVRRERERVKQGKQLQSTVLLGYCVNNLLILTGYVSTIEAQSGILQINHLLLWHLLIVTIPSGPNSVTITGKDWTRKREGEAKAQNDSRS